MDRLIKGYREFRKREWPRQRANYERLAKAGQKPEYLVIACSDSRSDPATVFNTRPGEIFTVRNIAAAVPPYEDENTIRGTSAAIAYAVLALGVRNIVVMGHAQCGGVAAAIDKNLAHGVPFVTPWVALLNPAVEKTASIADSHARHVATERECVKLSLERLMAFPFVAERVKAGTLQLDGARFGIADGKLELLDQKTGTFMPVERRRAFMRWF
ncbi:MAG TPA: carbonic anhydrase [Rhizomicrobium sp.]|jgi:carbonic anhydrase|nr:carbonic anhydrase [Rhizomicrobium sp.]